MDKKLRCGILGFGGIGHCHAAQYAGQPDVDLVAVCDIDPAKLDLEDVTINLGNSGRTDTARLAKYLSYEEMVNHETLDMVDICLPTYLHAEYAVRALQDGFNVLSEKPMAMTPDDCARMIEAAEAGGRLLMIAQCLRFSWEYLAIREAVGSGRYGKLLRLDLRRHGGPPGGWFRDGRLSGGAILDLHLHDVDFMIDLLGLPETVTCRGFRGVSGGFDECVAWFTYPDGLLVTAEGGWMRHGFAAAASAVFEKATLDLKDGVLSVLALDREPEVIPAPPGDNLYFNEIAYFADCIRRHRRPERALPESTRDSIRMVMLEMASAEAGGKCLPVKGE